MRSSRVFSLSFAAGAALLAACGGNSTGPSNSPPTADFTAPTCTVNVSCSFAGTGADTDGSIASFSWDFGDQTPAVTGQNVTHTFTTANTFQVKLTTTDNAGATGSATKAVTASASTGQGPTANFTVICNGLDCSFTDTSTPAGSLTYAWDFGEPSSGANNTSTAQNPTHSYTATAVTNFTVTLTVTDAQGTPSTPATQTITVTPPANLQCQTGGSLVDCTLDISSKATIKITMTSSSCEFTGNRLAITQPIQQTVFTNGCNQTVNPPGRVYTITGPNSDGSFDAGTQIQAQFTQGVGKPTDPTRGPPAIKLTGTFPTWTINIDDGGNPTGVGEPDFNDIVLSVQATTVP